MLSMAESIRMLKSNGAKKVSKAAAEEFKLIVKELAEDVAVRTVEQCKHRKRITVSKGDVRMATR